MKKTFPLAILLMFFGLFSHQAPIWAQGFIDALGDIPLMENMQIDPAATVQIEAASGRVVEVQANFSSWQLAKKFYRETLPSLGWKEVLGKADSSLQFVREQEILRLSTTDNRLLLFRLSPQE